MRVEREHKQRESEWFPWGAVVGDIVGSVYEWNPIKKTDFPLFAEESFFTDDTVLTIATAEALLEDKPDFAAAYRKWANRYPNAGYGGRFAQWVKDPDAGPYNSYGNGSGMRVAPVAYVARSIDEVLDLARQSAEVTHNHPEGIKGAQAVALAVYLARQQVAPMDFWGEMSSRFGYDMARTIDSIRSGYSFDVTCQGSVPESIICFLESNSCESAIRLAVSLGGDADTMACIAGGIAGAYYGVPRGMRNEVKCVLPKVMMQVIDRFGEKVNG